jgi:hypothetical protein
VQRLEHELRSARSSSLSVPPPPPPRRTSEPCLSSSLEHSLPNALHPGVQDYHHTAGLDVTTNAMCFWDPTYNQKPFRPQTSEWVANAPAKPTLGDLMIPSRCLPSSSDYVCRADSLSVSVLVTTASWRVERKLTLE